MFSCADGGDPGSGGGVAHRSEGSYGQQRGAHRIVGGTGITSLVHPIITDGLALPVPSGSRSREREKAAAQPQLKGEGSEAGPSPFSSEPFALPAPLGEALLVLTFPLMWFLDGPFAGVID